MVEAAEPNVGTKKKFYQKWWFWAIIVVLVIIGIANPSDTTKQSSNSQPEVTTATKNETSTQPQAEEPKVPAEYKSALSKATSYANMQHMSKQGVYDQLTSEYGEKFTAESAQYAINNVKADWNANALAKAKSYQSQQSMSPASIRDQLVSPYGEKFTEAEADYAIQHLND